LRERYLDPSSTDQFAFHEGFADVIAILSVFAIEEVVDTLLGGSPTIAKSRTTWEELQKTALLGLGQQIGAARPDSRGGALRRSVQLPPDVRILEREEFKEPHRRGEVFAAAMLKSFVHVWAQRVKDLGEVSKGRVNLARVVEDGAKAAKHLMTMAIRALDYCPPTGLTFSQYVSALIDADQELQPDDSQYRYRDHVRAQFAAYGISYERTGWRLTGNTQRKIDYNHTHFESMQRDPDEVFRFVWQNRGVLRLNELAYTKVISVRPCMRQSSDGFNLRETVAEYVQILNLTYGEVSGAIGREVDESLEDEPLRIHGGGTLIFDEYGRLKYHAQNPIPDLLRDKHRLADLWDFGLFEKTASNALSQLHLTRATMLPSMADKEESEW
jgi:hypothetical protein